MIAAPSESTKGRHTESDAAKLQAPTNAMVKESLRAVKHHAAALAEAAAMLECVQLSYVA